MVRVRGWVIHNAWNGPYKDRSTRICVFARKGERWGSSGKREYQGVRIYASVCLPVCKCLYVCFPSACAQASVRTACVCVHDGLPPVLHWSRTVAECPLLYLPFCQYDTVLLQPVIFTFLTLGKEAIWTEIQMIDILSLMLVDFLSSELLLADCCSKTTR